MGFNPSKEQFFFRRGCLAGQISRIEGWPSILENCRMRKSVGIHYNPHSGKVKKPVKIANFDDQKSGYEGKKVFP